MGSSGQRQKRNSFRWLRNSQWNQYLYFCQRLRVFLPANACIFACKSRQFCMLVAGEFTWVPHVKLSVKYPVYSSKFTCGCRQFACVLREVLAAYTRVHLPVFTGKLHVTHVNCVRGLFTCSPRVKLTAFAGNFACVSFTVLAVRFQHVFHS